MSEKIEMDTYKNIQVIKKKKSINKNRHGIDWWTEHQALSTFKDIKRDELRAANWNSIVKNTNIKSMHVQINGSGDSGGIEDIELFDKDDNKIEMKFHMYRFQLMADNFDYTAWKKKHIDESSNGHLTSDNIIQDGIKYQLTNTDAKKNRKQFVSELLNNGWNILEVSTSHWKSWLSTIELYKTYDSEETNNNREYWTHNPDRFKLEFPKLTYYCHDKRKTSNHLEDFLDSLYYNVLPGGWEINEGSYNSLIITDYLEEGNHYPCIEVEHNYYREEHENYKINNFEFLQKMDELGKGDNKTYNLDTKKGTEEFYTLINELRDIRGF